MVLWAQKRYRTLFSNLSVRTAARSLAQLTQMNILSLCQWQRRVEVPPTKVHELRLRLAQQGLLRRRGRRELLDQEKFGISQFSEQVNYQRALEGELADDRTLGR